MEQYRSVCPYDCPDACGLVVSVENGRVISVKGDETHPFTQGTMCPKMAHYERTVHSPRRLMTPLKRTGPKGRGEFEPISWDQALREIAASWKNHGREGTGPFTYSYAGTMGIVQHDALHGLFYYLGASELDRPFAPRPKGRATKTSWEACDGASGSAAQRLYLLVEHSHDGHQHPLQTRRRCG
ncbi:MAG: molybdopterin-dependent oxidoreductase [Megasphaera sp.]